MPKVLGTLVRESDSEDAFATPAQLLTKIKTVDGSGSGLDADTIDGIESSAIAKDGLESSLLYLSTVGGGSYVNNASNQIGAIKITLPVSWTNTMMKFTIELFNFSAGTSRRVTVSGYNYSATPTWSSVSADMDSEAGGGLLVRFGHDGTKACIWLGDVASSWNYVQVKIVDFQCAFNVVTRATWETGWAVGLVTSIDTVYATKTVYPSSDANNITTGTLPVVRGGTGVTTSTGSGNNVLSVSPTFSGTVTASAINANGTCVFSGQLQSAVNGSPGSPSVYYNGATNNWLAYNSNGIGAPATTTRSAGTKVAFLMGVNSTNVDMGMGVESQALWTSVRSATDSFKWYAGTTAVGTLTGAGALTVTGNIVAANFSGSSSGTNTGDQTTITGNAGSATILQTGRNFSITGGGITAAAISFNGSGNVALSASVDAGHITLARMANLAANSIIGNNTGSSATPIALTGTEVTAMLDVAGASKGLMSSTDKTKLDAITGTNTGDQTITLTGDITGTGTGSFATTIGANKVTLANMAQITTDSFLGRDTAGTGNVEVLSAASVKTILALDNVENKSSSTIRSEITSSNVTTALTYTPTSITGLTGVQSTSDIKTGLSLVKGDVGLGSVDNTSDLDKPVSTATQTALDGKEDTITATTSADYYRGDKTFATLDKTAVGLGNIDNTSDANKPISTATQTALDAKLDETHAGTGGTAHADVIAGGAAGFMTGSDKTKLDGVATGATANDTDANLKNRANHTGTQAQSTITNLTTDLAAKRNISDDYSDIIVVIDGGTGAIGTGIKCDIRLDFACTILEWTLLADQTGSIVVDIWKDTYANFPPISADYITGSEKPTISSAAKANSTTLAGWTTAISAGDILRFNVDSVTTITKVTLVLKVRKG
jgi:hypothetical protein